MTIQLGLHRAEKLLEHFYGNASSKSVLRVLECEISHRERVMVAACPLGFQLLREHFGEQEVTNKWSNNVGIIKMYVMAARYCHHSVLSERERALTSKR